MTTVLEVKGLKTQFFTQDGVVKAVNGISYDLNEGETVQGTVTNVASFGAFVEVGEGVEGLVHLSEMPDGDETRANLKPGDAVWVQVLRVDDRRRRISLSMRVAFWPGTLPAGQDVVAESEQDQPHEIAEQDTPTERDTEYVQGR